MMTFSLQNISIGMSRLLTSRPRIVSLELILLSLMTFAAYIPNETNAAAQKKVPIQLDENSWSNLLEGEWMFDLYAPWCPACRALEPEWKKFAEWSDDLNINVAAADVTVNPALTGRFMVQGLPTIYHVKDGVFRVYNGVRTHTALIDFIERQEWKTIEPVSRWFAPNTLQMSLLAMSFRISMALRDIHNHLVDNVGLPYYISYLIFALCTVTLGTLIGLVIVFAVDKVCPARATAPSEQSSGRARKPGRGKKDDNKNDSDLDDSQDQAVKASESKGQQGERLRKRTNK